MGIEKHLPDGEALLQSEKNKLRQFYTELRRQLTPEEKAEKDRGIFERLRSSEAYLKADTIYCFVSTPAEIDTHHLIVRAWKDHKQVAVPRCSNKKGDMRFYYIDSFEDLEPSLFSLLEPKKHCKEATRQENSICIVPGLAFDLTGHRLGYGRGYYDRFLPKYNEIKIGLCYNNHIASKSLPHGKYDVAVDYLFTEDSVKRVP